MAAGAHQHPRRGDPPDGIRGQAKTTHLAHTDNAHRTARHAPSRPASFIKACKIATAMVLPPL